MRFRSISAAVCALVLTLVSPLFGQTTDREPYLSWTAEQAKAIGKSTRKDGRAGGFLDLRIRRTERSYNYRLRATWLTPEVICATARLIQLQRALTDEETEALVAAGERAGDTVIMVEIDPSEGSGVIPLDWLALLRPKDFPDVQPARGRSEPQLRNVQALQGVESRDYAYDLFWVVFDLHDSNGEPIFPPNATEAELIVRIHDKEGVVTFDIPPSVRARALVLRSELPAVVD